MLTDEAVKTPQCSLPTSNAVSPPYISPIPNTKKRNGTQEHKAKSLAKQQASHLPEHNPSATSCKIQSHPWITAQGSVDHVI